MYVFKQPKKKYVKYAPSWLFCPSLHSTFSLHRNTVSVKMHSLILQFYHQISLLTNKKVDVCETQCQLTAMPKSSSNTAQQLSWVQLKSHSICIHWNTTFLIIVDRSAQTNYAITVKYLICSQTSFSKTNLFRSMSLITPSTITSSTNPNIYWITTMLASTRVASHKIDSLWIGIR